MSSGGRPKMLAERYDALFVDLDGVVYRGDQLVPPAASIIPEVRRRGITVLFLTNNSARTPAQVAEKLAGLGVEAAPGDVLTSAGAAAALLRAEGTQGRSAFVIGETGIREALEEAGIQLLDGQPEAVDLVVVGWDRSVDYAKLRTASLLVERGARLIATNRDASYPAPDGLWPGAGAILAAVTTTTGAEPLVVGKPARPLFQAAADMTGARRPLVVGDRLDTDIAGAAGMGWDSLLVLTGAARPSDLPVASSLPTYIGPDLSALGTDRRPARVRPATETDVSAITGLLASAGLDSDGVRDRLGNTVVAEATGDGRGITATACLDPIRIEPPAARSPRDEDPRPEAGAGILRSVAVSPSLRGQGLGYLVVARAIAAGLAAGITQVFLFTESAESFFRRLGFDVVRRDDLPRAVRMSGAAEACRTAAAMERKL